MEGARGMGRSGPRRKTGCLTCRRRKVRCDEAKPICAHCTRLRLQCVYKSNTTVPDGRRVEKRAPSIAASSASSSASDPTTFFSTVLQLEVQGSESLLPTFTCGTSSYGQDLPGQFDMGSFIGGITSELEQRQHGLNLTSGTSNQTSPASLSPFPFPDEDAHANGRRSTLPPDATINSPRSPIAAVPSTGADCPILDIWSVAKAAYEEQLLQHFLVIESPPAIFTPLDVEWKFVKKPLLALAREFNPLMQAIYCFSDIHKSKHEGRAWRSAPFYYRLASAEIQSRIIDDVTEGVLKKVFAAVFLLMFAELMSSPDLSRPGNSYLHTGYLLLKKFFNKTKSWRGLGRLLVSCISLLDVKALIAGRDGDPLVELGDLSESGSQNQVGCPNSVKQATAGEKEADEGFSNPSFLVYDAIVRPAFHFFVNAQQVIRRIVRIDLHHRSRGTLSDEFEVLQIAHRVGADLENLWNSRPPVLDVYDRPEELYDTLTRAIAVQVCRTFRQYVANFLANFIYLHRVAFAIYPRTDRVNGAVDKIIRLASVELDGTNHLPVSFLWPLFIAGLEGSLPQRQWILNQMRQMAENDNIVQRHPNADKALLLLEEMTRRQDASKASADSKCVRRELFPDFFIMI